MGTTGFVEPPSIVVSAAVLTACVTIGLTVYAMYTKTDFTVCGGSLFLLFFVIMGVGMLSMFTQSV
jgi:FtsH-binding integral membrane protein